MKTCFHALCAARALSLTFYFLAILFTHASCRRTMDVTAAPEESEIRRLEQKFKHLSLKFRKTNGKNDSTRNLRPVKDLKALESYLSALKTDTIRNLNVEYVLKPQSAGPLSRNAPQTYVYVGRAYMKYMNLILLAHIHYESNAVDLINTITHIDGMSSSGHTTWWVSSGFLFDIRHYYFYEPIVAFPMIADHGSKCYLDWSGEIIQRDIGMFLGYEWEMQRTAYFVWFQEELSANRLPFVI